MYDSIFFKSAPDSDSAIDEAPTYKIESHRLNKAKT